MTHKDHRSFPTWFLGHQYGILLGTLLLIYTIHPFVGERPWILAALQIASLMMTAAAIASFWQRRLIFVGAVLLGVIVQVLQIVHRFTDIPTQGVAAQVIQVLFLIVIIVGIAGRLLQFEKVSIDVIFGVCSIYLLMAIAWSHVYTTIEIMKPHSFNGGMMVEGVNATNDQKESDLLYFSLITMTTVGYGDITPATQPTRALSALQGLIGQLFLATILARIVSMEIGDRMAAKNARRPKEGD